MGVLSWIAGFILLFWVIGFFLKLGGGILYILLIAAVIMFVLDFIFGRGRNTKV